MDWFAGFFWTFAGLLLCNYRAELYMTWKSPGKTPVLVGLSPALVPRFLLNLFYAFSGASVVKKGHEKASLTKMQIQQKRIRSLTSRKFKDRPCQFIRGDGNVIVLPLDMIDELASLPETVATAGAGVEHDSLGHYSGTDLIVKTRLHRLTVQRRLTPQALSKLVYDIEDGATRAFEDTFPAHDNDWIEVKPYKDLLQVVARLASRALVGKPLCRDRKWLEMAVYYTENRKVTS